MLGNEACDLDSMVSSLVYAFTIYKVRSIKETVKHDNVCSLSLLSLKLMRCSRKLNYVHTTLPKGFLV